MDSLTTIRKLKENRVECCFEKENIWTFDGKVTVPFKCFPGYDRGEDGNLVVNEEQAETVRRIYGLFQQGHSPHAIAKLLMAEGIPSPGDKEVWSSSTVKSILTNKSTKGTRSCRKCTRWISSQKRRK